MATKAVGEAINPINTVPFLGSRALAERHGSGLRPKWYGSWRRARLAASDLTKAGMPAHVESIPHVDATTYIVVLDS
jgi:hypothetical protein